MGHPLSLRLADPTIRRLDSRARRVRLPPRSLAQRYIEEGLRMDEHPLVRFVDGPMGRRPMLLGTGLDVSEIIGTLRENGGTVRRAAKYLELPLGLVQAAASYYGAYRREIDEEIALANGEREEAEATVRAGHVALKR